MTFDTTAVAYQELRARVVQSRGQVVPFVGAGLSVYGDVAQRMPLWRELIDRLEAEGREIGLIGENGDSALKAAVAANRYIEAIDRLVGLLGEPNFRRVVERELSDSNRPTPPSIAELVAVGWSLIVTTNLDRLIARAYLERYGRPPTSFTSINSHRLAAAMAGTLTSDDTLLAYIHGSIDDYSSWRLSKPHYEQLLQDPGYVEALKHLFLRQVFFVGFGLQDEDLDMMFANIARIYPAGVGEFYALLPRFRQKDPVVLDLVRNNGLRPIFYDVATDSADDPFGGHREVFECLHDLAKAWASNARRLDVTLKHFPELDPSIVGRESEARRLAEFAVEGTGLVQVIGLGGVGKTTLVQQALAMASPDLADAGYRTVFGFSFTREDIAQFVNDLALTSVGPAAVPLPEQVERVCENLRRHRTVLLLDSLEELLDADGMILNPYVQQIVRSVITGRGCVIVTSRIPIEGGAFSQAMRIRLDGLTTEEAARFLRQWGLADLGKDAIGRLSEATGGHPLALRVLAGLLSTIPTEDALHTIDYSKVLEVPDEADPLRENRLSRVLESYLHHLSAVEVDLLMAASVFDEPVSYAQFERVLGRHYPNTQATQTIADTDLRPLVARLLDLRLLGHSPAGELASHPAVHDYFGRLARDRNIDLAPLHRAVAADLIERAGPKAFTLAEAKPLLSAARHAADCGDWTLFDDIVRQRLLHDHVDYLCDYLGAWNETLALARRACGSSYPAGETPHPAYYPLVVARCLKHLGRSAESRTAYLTGLPQAAASRDPNTAMYVNNFVTLLIWRGELKSASFLAETNIRALSWISDDWRFRCQLEYGMSSLAYLRTLQGQVEAAVEMFDASAHAWDGFLGERTWRWDYYPFYRSEAILLSDSSAHDEAMASIEPLLTVAERRGWPEPTCRGLIQAAAVHIDRAARNADDADLTQARRLLRQARTISAGMRVPDVEIAHSLTSFRADVIGHSTGLEQSFDIKAATSILDHTEAIMRATELGLARPELIAARGVVAFVSGETDHDAAAALSKATAECRKQGNAWAPRSPRSFVHWLADALNADTQSVEEDAQSAEEEQADLLRLVGAHLDPEDLGQRLAQLTHETRLKARNSQRSNPS